MIHYLAYGSNLHPVRLIERVPSAQLLGTTELSGYRLVFHKSSHDGSGKCNLLKTNLKTDSAFGALYALDAEHKSNLDEFESKGFGYIDRQIDVMHLGQSTACFTYFAQNAFIVDKLEPYHWYKQLVLQGARYLKFPDSYVSAIESIASQKDPDIARRQHHATLLGKIADYPEPPGSAVRSGTRSS